MIDRRDNTLARILGHEWPSERICGMDNVLHPNNGNKNLNNSLYLERSCSTEHTNTLTNIQNNIFSFAAVSIFRGYTTPWVRSVYPFLDQNI
jgi:hypothetical protein